MQIRVFFPLKENKIKNTHKPDINEELDADLECI